MNVFEDLIEELRDENLLEDTVIDVTKSTPGNVEHASPRERQDVHADEAPHGEIDGSAQVDTDFDLPESPPDDERDFYRKRAMDEVSSLQMVEHIFSGIEREHMKQMPSAYDDLEAKKALHRFLQVQTDPTTTDYAEAEFKLMNETELWNSALCERDKKISVSNLRRFCENSRPALSSQALMSLCRFYRNASYSELSRAKFDLVMTRLFSREGDEEKRRLLFSRPEMVGHIRTLYANWSSVALYSAEDAPMKTRAVVAGFDDRVAETEKAETFEQLIQNDFFKKVHEFKEATGEMFFTPEIVAATIDCNVRIGNKFVDLIRLERENTNLENVEQKYGYAYDQIISDAAGKTLHLVELLKTLPDSDEGESYTPQVKTAVSSRTAEKDKGSFFGADMFRVNKWLLATTILVAIATVGLYFWSSQPSADSQLADTAKNVDLDGTPLKDYLRSGRATSETFYAIVLPGWEELPELKQKEILQQALVLANQQSLSSVQLINNQGRSVGVASKDKVEVVNSP